MSPNRSPLPRFLAGLLLAALGLAAANQAQEETEPADVVVRILVEGTSRYTDEQMIAALGQRVGEPLDFAVINRGIMAIFDTFRARATVDVREVEGGVELRLRISELPRDLEPRFIGNVEVSAEELYEWARLDRDSELYLYQAPRIRARLIDAYKKDGFYFVEIDQVIREGGETPEGPVAPDVIFEIHEGPQVHVRDVIVEGNESMPDRGALFWKDGLSEFADVELTPPRFFRIFKDEFDEEALRGDLQAMRGVYRERGWLDAVVELDRLEFSDDRSWVTVYLRIDEGPRYRVGSLAIEAFERFGTPDADGLYPERPADLLFPEEELLELCELQPGEFYETRRQRRDARALRDYFGERGYIFHPTLPELDRWEFLEGELVFEAEDPVVHVTYRIAQGKQQFIREILLSGNSNTQDRVVRGRITVEPGKIADLGQIERSRARIQGLGFFSDQRPDVEHNDPTFRFLATDDPAWKDVEYIVEETNALGFNISGGITSNSGLFGIISLTKQNFDIFDPPDSFGGMFEEIAEGRAFHGAGQNLRILVAPGTDASSFEVRFREPDIFRRYTDRIGLDLTARRRLRIFESHDEEREEYGIGLRYQVGPDSFVRTAYFAGGVEVDDLSPGGEPTLGSPLTVPELLKDQEGENDLAWLELAYEFGDLDDFFNPQNGTTFELASQVYSDAWGSDFDFVKATAQWQHFGQFGEKTEDARPGYKLELGIGVAAPFGSTDDVPYSERYFLGGQRTLRGFDFRGVGPNENGFPQGGETYLAGTIEYRRPLLTTVQPGSFREIEVVRGGLFFDIGILDPDAFELDPDELRAAAGVIFGLTVPLPFTFSIGFPVREGDGDDPRTIQFNIGF